MLGAWKLTGNRGEGEILDAPTLLETSKKMMVQKIEAEEFAKCRRKKPTVRAEGDPEESKRLVG